MITGNEEICLWVSSDWRQGGVLVLMALYCHLLLSALCNALFCCHLLTVVQPFGNLKSSHVHPGVSIPPETMMHFPPCFRFSPLFQKNFSDFLKNFNNLTFSRKISWLSAAKISDDLFYANSPAFYILYVYFPPYFDHDAFMHHPMHVLDAPGYCCGKQCELLWTNF